MAEQGSDLESLKRAAAARALEDVHSGMLLGLGTGSTVRHFLDLLGERVASGELRDVVGVPTSERTADRARRLGIPLATLEEHPRLDLTVDGADEIDPRLDLVKGLGGALLREKIVAQASRRFVIIADGTKIVDRLGTRAPLPVEVVPFGWTAQRAHLADLGGDAVIRTTGDGSPYVTDNGNYVLDVSFAGGIPDPAGLERAIRGRAGIVETGLFVGLAEAAHIAIAGRVETRRRPGSGDG